MRAVVRWHVMPPAGQLHRVDIFLDQRPAHADGTGNGDDRSNGDVIISGHFENHHDRGHGGTGAAADQPSHPDKGKGDWAEPKRGPDRCQKRPESTTQRCPKEQGR